MADLGAIAFDTGLLQQSAKRLVIASYVRNGSGTITGTITESGVGVARTVRIHHRATGTLLGETVSDAVTGAYSVPIDTNDEIYRVVLDDVSGTVYNDLIDRVIPG
jgi:hypothetical protein